MKEKDMKANIFARFLLLLATLVLVCQYSLGQAPPPQHSMAGIAPNGAMAYMSLDSLGNLLTTGGSGGTLLYIPGYIPPYAPMAIDPNGIFQYLQIDSSGNLKTAGLATGIIGYIIGIAPGNIFVNPCTSAYQIPYEGPLGMGCLNGPTGPAGVPLALIEQPSGGLPGIPTWALAGVTVDLTNPATLPITDRGAILYWTSGAALALPAISQVPSTGTGLNFHFQIFNNTATALVITPNAGNSDLCVAPGLAAAATCTLNPYSGAFISQGPGAAPGLWYLESLPTTYEGFFGATAPNPNLGTSGGNLAVCGSAFTGIASDGGWYCNASNFFDLMSGTTDLGSAVAESAVLTVGQVACAVGTTPQLTACSITDNGTTVKTTEPILAGNTSVLTGAGTTTSASLAVFTTNSLVMPTLPISTSRYGFCDLIWGTSNVTGTVILGLKTSATLTGLQILDSKSYVATAAIVNFQPVAAVATATSTAFTGSLTATGTTVTNATHFGFSVITNASNAQTITVVGDITGGFTLTLGAGSSCGWLP